MGAWGLDTFDNDTACDWGYDLEEGDDLSLVRSTIDAALAAPDLDADSGCQVLAAGEVIARLKGNFGERTSYTETVDAWVAAHPMTVPPALVDQAVHAIKRVVSESSELHELWAETDELATWLERVADLERRVAK